MTTTTAPKLAREVADLFGIEPEFDEEGRMRYHDGSVQDGIQRCTVTVAISMRIVAVAAWVRNPLTDRWVKAGARVWRLGSGMDSPLGKIAHQFGMFPAGTVYWDLDSQSGWARLVTKAAKNREEVEQRILGW